MGLDWSGFLLVHPYPDDFVTSQWQRNPTKVSPVYLVYRLVILLFAVASFVYDIATYADDADPGDGCQRELKFYPIYLTHWGITFVVLFEIFDSILVGRELWLERQDRYYQRS